LTDAQVQKYTRGLFVGRTPQIHLDISLIFHAELEITTQTFSPTPPQIFTVIE